GHLRRYNRSSFQLQQEYSFSQTLTEPIDTRPLDVGPDGTVYIGTSSGVLVIFPGGTSTTYTTANSGIPGDDVRCVRVDPATGMLWVAPDGGAGRFDPHYVPPAPPSAEHLQVRVYPNPAQLFSGIGVELRLDGNVSAMSGTVYDLSGRRVRRFESANGRIF